MVEQHAQARLLLLPVEDGEVEHVAMRAAARHAQADQPLAVRREARRHLRPTPCVNCRTWWRRRRCPQGRIWFDAVAPDFLLGGAVGVTTSVARRGDHCGSPYQKASLSAGGCGSPPSGPDAPPGGDPDMGRAVTGVALALVGRTTRTSRSISSGVRGSLPSSATEDERLAVGERPRGAVETVVEDAAIGLVRAGQGIAAPPWSGSSQTCGRVDCGGGRRRLLPASGRGTGREEGDQRPSGETTGARPSGWSVSRAAPRSRLPSANHNACRFDTVVDPLRT